MRFASAARMRAVVAEIPASIPSICAAEAVEELVEGHAHHHCHHGTVSTGSVTADRVAEEFFGGIGAALRHRAVINVGDPGVGQRRRNLIPCGP